MMKMNTGDRMNILIQVTLYDEDGKVTEQTIHHYWGSYGWEVEQLFEKIGKEVAPKIDPSLA